MKQFTGSCYVGVVGAETDNGQCYDSISVMYKRPGDTFQSIRATKGFEARQQHLDNFIASKHDFLFLMDSDMIFPVGTLERLRSHGLPFVSGLYMRRTYAPVLPIWFRNGQKGVMPMAWFTGQIAPDTLYPIGASGWGCMLIHREVILSVRAILKGEPEIIEDDMDVYPYDLGRVMNSINAISEMSSRMKVDIIALRAHAKVLQSEIRPLRAVKSNVGSDLRFPFYAKLAGWQLMGDSGAACNHMLNYPIKVTDYPGMHENYTPDMTAALDKSAAQAYRDEKARINAALDGVK